MNDAIELACGNCGGRMKVHRPIMTRLDDGLVSTVMLVPSWSPEERKCQGCGYTITPVFEAQLPMKWVSLPTVQKAEEARIILPGPIPMDVAKRLKTG